MRQKRCGNRSKCQSAGGGSEEEKGTDEIANRKESKQRFRKIGVS